MLIGGAIGSTVGRLFAMGERERRILMLAGVAAGIAAVFRTPLGAALLAVEILYKDGFESDALIPAVLASVMSYSVVISIHGRTTLFGHSGDGFPFVPAHLLLYGVLAALVSLLAIALSARPAAGARLVQPQPPAPLDPAGAGRPGAGRVLDAGAGDRRAGSPTCPVRGWGSWAAATARSSWPSRDRPGRPWAGARSLLLAMLSLAKLVAASLTIGSGGSAGDFAPSLAMGGLLGGAFGQAAQLMLGDPRIDPAAFALVGMGAFYGGVAHVPLAALVLVCEMAGNYDLLVPLMLALGISCVALRRHSLYEAQVATQRESPIYRQPPADPPPPGRFVAVVKTRVSPGGKRRLRGIYTGAEHAKSAERYQSSGQRRFPARYKAPAGPERSKGIRLPQQSKEDPRP